MTSKTITITSKNQITLPAALVREMGLAKSRQLKIRRRGSELILTPQPTLKEAMQEIWDSLPPMKGTKTDEELQAAIHQAMLNGLSRKV